MCLAEGSAGQQLLVHGRLLVNTFHHLLGSHGQGQELVGVAELLVLVGSGDGSQVSVTLVTTSSGVPAGSIRNFQTLIVTS